MPLVARTLDRRTYVLHVGSGTITYTPLHQELAGALGLGASALTAAAVVAVLGVVPLAALLHYWRGYTWVKAAAASIGIIGVLGLARNLWPATGPAIPPPMSFGPPATPQGAVQAASSTPIAAS